MISNQELGKNTETLFLEKVNGENGWITFIPSTRLGQPFDTIGVWHDKTWFIDVKHCATDTFRFSEIRENQKNAMELLHRKQGSADIMVGFAIYFAPEGVFKLFRYKDYKKLFKANIKHIKASSHLLEVMFDG